MIRHPRPTPDGELLRWPWGLWLFPVVPLAILLVSSLVPQRLLELQPAGPSTWVSEPFFLEAGPLGSPFLMVRAQLPRNTQITYGVELLDPAGQVVFSLSREGWRETGVWNEEGESGTYDESDSDLPLALRPPRQGVHRLRLRQEALSGSDGRPSGESVAFAVSLARHRVNAPLLWLTSAAALVASTCAWLVMYSPCRRRVVVRSREPRLSLRTDLGPGLVRLSLQVGYWAMEGQPRKVPPQPRLRLRLRDGWGRLRLQESRPIALQDATRKEKPLLRGHQTLLVRVPERTSYQLLLEVPNSLGSSPDALESVRLTLEDGVRVPRRREVLEPWSER